jgi:DNA-binding MarR family transcriptional regulator
LDDAGWARDEFQDVKNPLLAVLHAASSLETQVDARLATVGLSLPKLAALHALVSAGDALPLGQLADRLACVKSNVTQLIDRLEADGLVSRAHDPTDRRSTIAAITDTGRRAYEQGLRIQQDTEKVLFGVFTDDESAQLAHLIQKLRPH